MKSFLLLSVFTSVALAAAPFRPPIQAPLQDLTGVIHELGQNDERKIRVFVFIGTECPIARVYTPLLNSMAAHRGADVDFFGVLHESETTHAAAVAHAREFKIRFPVLWDPSGLLANALRPTHLPEAFVLNRDGVLVYRGAIDNAYVEVGRRRATVTVHYLAEAITAARAGQAPTQAAIPPVGCFHESGSLVAKPVYTRHIAPLVHTRCLNCHREGQAAPFPLGTPVQAAKRARQIARVVDERIMPPWIPAAGHEPFVGKRALTLTEISLLRQWAEQGSPAGAPEDQPPLPAFASGWHLGKPDMIVKMTVPFRVPADGPDLLQNFVIPLPLDGDRIVSAVEFHPGNPRVVHHAVLFLDDKGQARRRDEATPEPGYSNFGSPGFLPSGALGGWSVGNTARRLPNGMGRMLKKGSDVVVQMHYHPTGKVETDQSTIGLYFLNRPVEDVLKDKAKLVGSLWLANYELDIPAGKADYRRSTSYVLPRAVTMVGVVPHMHLLGRSMRALARLPDGSTRVLVDVPRWNYNWQDEYYFERPFSLPAGTRLEVEAVFDNSSGNPSNPSSPPKRVTWGDGTLDEMLFCFFLLTADRTEDLVHVILDNLGHDLRQPRSDARP